MRNYAYVGKERSTMHTATMTTKNGTELTFTRFPATLLSHVYMQFPRPVMPKRKVQTGPDEVIEIDDDTNPAYIADTRAWQIDVYQAINSLVIDVCVTNVLTDDEQAAVNMLRARLKATPLGHVVKDMSDVNVFVRYIAITETDELAETIAKLQGNVGFTAAGVSAAKETF